jgi:hypothetical protein
LQFLSSHINFSIAWVGISSANSIKWIECSFSRSVHFWYNKLCYFIVSSSTHSFIMEVL